MEMNKVIVTGNVTNEEVIKVLQKIRKTAIPWQDDELNNINYQRILAIIKIREENKNLNSDVVSDGWIYFVENFETLFYFIIIESKDLVQIYKN